MIPYAKFKIHPKNILYLILYLIFFFTFDKTIRFYGLIQYNIKKKNNNWSNNNIIYDLTFRELILLIS